MKIFILFFVLTAFLSSQEQIKWKNEGSSSEIRVRYKLQNENIMLFLSVVNSKNFIQFYDYENNEILSNIDVVDALSLNLSYDNSIFIINKDNQNKIYRYDYNGNILKEYQVSSALKNSIEYDENKVFTQTIIDGVNKFVQYDLINDEIIAEYPEFNIGLIVNSYIIDKKLFITVILKDNSAKTLTFDLIKKEFLKSNDEITSLVRNYEVFDNTIVTFHQQRIDGALTQLITYWDRNTLDTLKSYKIITDDDYIEVLNETDPIVVRIDSNNSIQEYNFETGEVVKEIKAGFQYTHSIKLNDGYYYGYNFWGNFNFNIYNAEFNDLYGKLYPVPSSSHQSFVSGVRIVGDKIVTGGGDGFVLEWETDGEYIKSTVNSNNSIQSLDYSEKHNLIGVAYGYPQGRVEIYDASTWELKFEKDYPKSISSIRFNDEIDKFLTMGFKNDIDVFDSENFNLVNTIETVKDSTPVDLECSAILLDDSKLAYTYKRGLIIYDYVENKELANKQLYETSGLSPVIYLEKSKTKNELLVSGYNQSVFIVDYNLNATDTILPNFTDINGKNYLGFSKYKSSFINDSLLYILGQQHLVVYNINQDSVLKDYNEMNPGGYTNVGLKFLDFDFNSEIITAVNNYGDVYGLVPYTVITNVEKNITRDLVYPNPVKSEFKLNLDYLDEVKIFDLNGLIIKDIKHNSDKINISDIPSGVYYLQVKQNNELIYTKLVKE